MISIAFRPIHFGSVVTPVKAAEKPIQAASQDRDIFTFLNTLLSAQNIAEDPNFFTASTSRFPGIDAQLLRGFRNYRGSIKAFIINGERFILVKKGSSFLIHHINNTGKADFYLDVHESYDSKYKTSVFEYNNIRKNHFMNTCYSSAEAVIFIKKQLESLFESGQVGNFAPIEIMPGSRGYRVFPILDPIRRKIAEYQA